jgi:hypothetical protein
LLLREKCEWKNFSFNFLCCVDETPATKYYIFILTCGTKWMAKALIKVIINQLTAMFGSLGSLLKEK